MRGVEVLTLEIIKSHEALFWSKVERKADSCWIWRSGRSDTGYGTFSVKRRSYNAHRIAWMLAYGEIPHGKWVDHLCRVRSCVNPLHLELVTPRENIMRGHSPNVVNSRNNICHLGHELTPENSYIRPGGSSRQCRICQRLREKRRVRNVLRMRVRERSTKL
jgi:hypothetical protein